MYICCAAWVEEHVALADARLGLQQARVQKRFAHARAVTNPQTAIARGYARLARRLGAQK